MQQIQNKILLTLIGIFLLITPANVNALILLNGTSGSGNINMLASIFIPLPLINLTITESEETDFFGIAQLIISDHDDSKKHNMLQISTGLKDPIEFPVPYGSFGLNYLMLPNGLPPSGVDQSDIYGYFSVANGSVVSDIRTTVNLTISLEREEFIELLTPFMPPEMDLDQFIGEGPFDSDFSLDGELTGTATENSPTISGEFNYLLTLPEDIFILENGLFEMTTPDTFQGKLSIEASFNWDNWNFFFPFATAELSITQTLAEEELQLDPINLDFLPGGTFTLWLDGAN